MPATTASPRPSAYRWLVFALLALAYLLVYFHRTSPAVVALDMMRDLEASEALLGLLASAYFYPYALMQLPAGLLSDSWGPRRTITLFFLLAGAASIFFGLAESVATATAARVLVGLGVSMLFVPTIKVLTRWFRLREFAFMMGLLMAVGGLGVLGAAGPLAYLSAALGWRGSFLAIGGLTLALAVAIWFLVRNSPEEKGLPAAESPKAGGPPPESIGLGAGMRMVLAQPRFWPIAIWFFCTSGMFFSFVGLWGGPFLMHVHGLTKAQAGGVLNMAAVGMILGSPGLSWLSDKVLHSRKKVLVGSAMLVLLLVVPLVFWPTAFSLAGLYVWCLLFSVFTSSVVVIAFTTTKELFPVSIAGTATGLVNLFPFSGGAVLQPVVGLILQGQEKVQGVPSPAGYGRAFTVFLVAAVLALAASFLLKETLAPRREAA
ncbi:MAG: MFS transporter [Desulfarculus sp.]|nr:MFS transporter [Desulfarculus sp.]